MSDISLENRYMEFRLNDQNFALPLISVKEVVEIISAIEPKIIIPMHYWKAGMNKEKFGELSDISFFLKEMGKESIQPVAKLSVTKDKIPAEATITVLE